MALKNLFDMVKADRYTADGREEIIKAQEAETEDVKYNIGDISQKTGLQKTANGWVKPKKNKEIQNAGKHAESVKAAQKAKKEEARRQQRAEGEANARAFQEKVEKGEIKPDGAEVHQQQGEEIKGNLEAAKYYFDKAQSFSPTDPSYKTYMTMAKQYNDEAKAQADDNGFDFEEMHNSGVTQAVNKYAEEQSKPAAQEVKLGGGADTYYFEDPDNMSNEDKVFKSLGIELAETFGDHDGEPGNTETWANGWLDNIMDNGGLGIKSKKTRQPAAPVPAEEVMRIVEENPARWNRIIGNAKKFYEGKGRSTDFESDEFYPIKLVGGKTKPSAQYYAEGKRNEKNNPLTGKYVTQRQNTSKDAAPSLSEIVDRVYNIGEISEKTGLQKTANGWVKPKKGAGPAKKEAQGALKTFNKMTGSNKSDFESVKSEYNKALEKNTGKSATESKPAAGNNPGNTSWKEAKIGLVNQNDVALSLSDLTFGMTAAWAEKNGYSPDEVNGNAAQVKLAKQIITNQDWSNPEEAVKKINDLDFGYNNWKVTEKQDDKVKIEAKDSLGNLHKLTIKRPQAAPAPSTESKPAEAPKFKSRNTIMMEKNGFKEVEKGGAFPKLHRFQYKSLSGRNYNVYRDIDSNGFIYHVQTPGGFTKKMRDVKEIVRYLDSDGGNWGDFSHRTRGELIPGSVGREAKAKVLKNAPAEKRALYENSNDSAPRVLTGDCRIRIRKEKPALTGDTKIRVRK